MKKKTQKRLKQKWENLPLHHIDASVILEILLRGAYEKECKHYLNKVGLNFRGTISVPVLGEIDKGIILKIGDMVGREISRTFVDRLIVTKKIRLYSSTFGAYEISLKIREMNTFVKPMDALHVACAIKDRAKTFVTLDNELLKTNEIEKRYKIKIKHPQQL